MDLSAGANVLVHSLAGRPELNGRMGMVLGAHQAPTGSDSGRLRIQVGTEYTYSSTGT